MKYPKLKPEQRRNQKLTPMMIAKIKQLHKSGLSVWNISKKLGFKYETIKRQTDPEFKKQFNVKFLFTKWNNFFEIRIDLFVISQYSQLRKPGIL